LRSSNDLAPNSLNLYDSLLFMTHVHFRRNNVRNCLGSVTAIAVAVQRTRQAHMAHDFVCVYLTVQLTRSCATISFFNSQTPHLWCNLCVHLLFKKI